MFSDRRFPDNYRGAVTTGILLVLPFSLLNLQVIAWFALVPLLLCICRHSRISGSRTRSVFAAGYVSGVIWNIGSLFWVKVFDPVALPLVVFILALYPALFCLGLSSLIKNRNDTAIIWAAPLLWTSLEYIRSLGFFGFPWNSLGYSQYRQIPVIQMAEFTGVFGVSFLIVLVNSGIAWCLLNNRKLLSRLKILAAISVVMGLCILWGASAARVYLQGKSIPPQSPFNSPFNKGGIRVALIQPNVSAAQSRWDENFPGIMERLSGLSAAAACAGPDLIIWPETAVGEDPETVFIANSWLRKQLCQITDQTGAYLLTGAVHYRNGKDHNSAFLISPDCKLIDRYDKIHLVPAGEYFPFWRHTRFMRFMLRNAGNFTPGERLTVFEIPGKGKFGTLICFEGIFGDLTRRFVKHGADFLVNITNDVWSKSRLSHYQHASMATFRAVENRVYFVRVGNSGVSRIINPCGGIEKNLDAYTSGFLVGEISAPTGMTFYTSYGDVFAMGVLVVTFLICVRSNLAIGSISTSSRQARTIRIA